METQFVHRGQIKLRGNENGWPLNRGKPLRTGAAVGRVVAEASVDGDLEPGFRPAADTLLARMEKALAGDDFSYSVNRRLYRQVDLAERAALVRFAGIVHEPTGDIEADVGTDKEANLHDDLARANEGNIEFLIDIGDCRSNRKAFEVTNQLPGPLH